MKTFITTALLCLAATTTMAQETAQKSEPEAKAETKASINVHGTIRSKYELQTEEGEHRFEVRNARVSIDGVLSPIIYYKAEIDLCEEGKISMRSA